MATENPDPLDRSLDRSNPRTSRALEDDLSLLGGLLTETVRASRRRPTRAWTVSAVALTVAFAGTTAAAATGAFERWGFVPDVTVQQQGPAASCSYAFVIQPDQHFYDPGSAADARALAAARRILADIDIAAIDTTRQEASIAAGAVGSATAYASEPGVFRSSALTWLLHTRVRAELIREGYDPKAVSLEMAGDCASTSPSPTAR